MAVKITEYDLSIGPRDLTDLDAYSHVLLLLQWRNSTLGQMRLAVHHGRVPAMQLWWSAGVLLGGKLIQCAVKEVVSATTGAGAETENQFSRSIVVCTRDRPQDLRTCLNSICPAVDSSTEIIVVDNAPSNHLTEQLTRNFPVRYIREPCQGLNWARNRGVEEAKGEIVIFIDDDAVAGRNWLEAILLPFNDPAVAAVTGLVMPYELENEAQERFEAYCGFHRGFRRKEFTAQNISPLAASNVGAGACMALRRKLVNELDLFRVELDCGTAARSGGDTYAFYRLLSHGHRIIYEPDAVVWHRHRRTTKELCETLYGYSVGTYCFLFRCLLKHGEFSAIRVGLHWFFRHHLRQLWRGLRGKWDAPPVSLTWAEIRGTISAPWAYYMSRRSEHSKIKKFLPPGHDLDGGA